jgi:hypothetical protein
MCLLFFGLQWVFFVGCITLPIPSSSFEDCLNFKTDTVVNCVISENYTFTESDDDIPLYANIAYTILSPTPISPTELYSLTLNIKRIIVPEESICTFEKLEV